MSMEISGYSVLKGLKEFFVICSGVGGMVWGGGKDTAWKCCSNRVWSREVEFSFRICREKSGWLKLMYNFILKNGERIKYSDCVY